MISLEEAQSRLIALATPLPVEAMPLMDAIGRWTAAPIVALRTQPDRPLSAMDGYAVADGAGPWRVIGESAAGARFKGNVWPGEAVRIFTGAALPDGADRVIIQEDVTCVGKSIAIGPDLVAPSGQHVRAVGSDFALADQLIEVGERLTPARIALAAMGGHGSVPVRRRVRVALISTGSELVEPGEALGEDQIPASNGIMIAAMLRDYRCDIVSQGIVPDRLEALVSAIRATQADVIVTTGGASVGDHDLVQPALIAAGATLDFWKVAMRPGKPLMAGRLGPSLVLGLPGNPVSAFATALLFLRPLIASLSGAADPLPLREPAILDGDLPATGPRTDHIRARRLMGTVTPIGRNDSAALRALAASDALIIRPPNAPAAQTGDRVEIISLRE